MNNGIALYCPTCSKDQMEKYHKAWPFGSISSQGQLIIKRKADYPGNPQITVILMREGTIACSCGYQVYYNHGKISTEVQPSGYQYEYI